MKFHTIIIFTVIILWVSVILGQVIHHFRTLGDEKEPTVLIETDGGPDTIYMVQLPINYDTGEKDTLYANRANLVGGKSLFVFGGFKYIKENGSVFIGDSAEIDLKTKEVSNIKNLKIYQ